MALKLIGSATCPYCGGSAKVGISKDGRGNAVHVMCLPCNLQVQAHRFGPTGRFLEQRCLGSDLDFEPPVRAIPTDPEAHEPAAIANKSEELEWWAQDRPPSTSEA